MKQVYKICLVNVGIAVLLAMLLIFGSGGPLGSNDYVGFLGLVCISMGPIDLIIGLLLLVIGKKIWGQGFLLSAGVLLLLGFAMCSAMR